MLIFAVIIVLAVVQSLFGVGLLVFGTPTLLLLGYPYQDALAILLPAPLVAVSDTLAVIDVVVPLAVGNVRLVEVVVVVRVDVDVVVPVAAPVAVAPQGGAGGHSHSEGEE